MNQPERPRGYIGLSVRTWADCGICGEAEELDAQQKRAAAREAAAKGWRYLDHRGWICPACQQKREARDRD